MTFWKLMQYKSVKPAEQQGFTLIEVMVVVVIIAILASIAFPSYQNYVLRSGRTDARDALLSVAQQLERNYTQQNTYVNTSFDKYKGDGSSSSAGLYTIKISNYTATSYTLTATPRDRQAKDTDCTSFTLNQAGVRASGPKTNCW